MSILTIFYVVLFLSGIDCLTTNSTSETTTDSVTSTIAETSTPTDSMKHSTNLTSVTNETATTNTTPSASSDPSTYTDNSNDTTTSETSTEQITSNSTAAPTTNSKQTTGGNTTSTQSSSTLTLEEKQKRIGITSAVICVGSLILVGIAYLSSFVDKPSDKISRDAIKQFAENSRYKYDNDGKIIKDSKPGMDKKISFGDNVSSQVASNLGIKRDAEAAGTSKDYTEMKSINEKYPNTNIENRKRNKDRKSGWDILSDNPKYFDNYQPKTSIEDGDDNP